MAPTSSAAAQFADDAKLVNIGAFHQPLHLTSPPGDSQRLFVVEKPGRIQVMLNGQRLAQPFLDIADEISLSEEGGLLSMAFAPDYASSGRFYVIYSDLDRNIRLDEFTRSSSNPNLADESQRRQVLLIERPPDAQFGDTHYGGLLLFGPDDLLYIGIGDGGPTAREAQRLDSLQGKILRIDPSTGDPYSIPASNPFVDTPGARPEIYSYGFRNPWRFTFDSLTGDLYIADVGQGRREEVDFAFGDAEGGQNYGWPCFEGSLPFDTAASCESPVFPTFQYAHQNGRCSITGGVVSRDPAVPALSGRYLYADLCSRELRSLRVVSGKPQDDRSLFGMLNLNPPKVCLPSSFGVDAVRRVYVLSLCGPVYRLARP